MTSSEVQKHIESLMVLVRLRKAANRAFDPLGFSVYEAMILIFIEQGVKQPSELAKLIDINVTSVAPLVTKLTKRELVVRKKLEADGRVIHLSLTIARVVAVNKIIEAWVAHQPPGSWTNK